MNRKLKVGVLGATGFVGQRLITLLDNHPYFEIAVLAASERSAGKSYEDAVGGKWKLNIPMPEKVKNMVVKNINEVEEISSLVDFVFCAVNMPADEIRKIEEAYAKAETPVVSNNSAHRKTPDVPVIIPEINADHLKIIDAQKKRLGTKRGFIVAKPNCSIQSYVPAINALMEFKPNKILVCTYQAISGSGKIFSDWPEMNDNIIPYIGGEEEKSEQEPLKVWGHIEGDKIVNANEPVITAQCIRVPVSDGHMAAVFVSFDKKPSKEEILERWKTFKGKPQELNLPNAPEQFLTYFEEENRPQTKLDRDIEKGMGITVGRLREDSLFDYKFVCLSHNTLRGAAGGSVLTAELLAAERYFNLK
ncbi:aspartate-semialdehyde dehydrogenase [Fervidicella metallireducens AeB]|uniref:Aspartate-semialdehyde dehydrogenase n=1 Tax=Fervidicella metallireducens AeB TaxID=1403537 RepID=A0A017RWI5_9CLOT|nr:aspartate-semialdehyde dehydrogenase [Fervidicella metallireducens]EYE89118.1 aspartate-semialdehyde dehydrogenase [Fervidicella metallireducens AeB]